MSNNHYQVIFSGELLADHTREAVQKNLAVIFKKTPEQVAALFSGNAVVIKKDIDKETALKYQLVLKKAGAICEIQSTQVEPGKTTQAASHEATSSGARMLRATRDDVNLEIPDDLSDLSIAAPGEILISARPPQPAVPVSDLSGLSLAAPGTRLSTPREIKAPTIKAIELSLENLD